MNWYEKFQGLFKREITPTEMEAVFARLDVEQFFNTLNNLWNPSELIKKIGGLEKLPLLYKDSEIFAAVDKRLAALLDTKLVFEDGDEDLIKFFTEQILPHEQQLKKDFWWSVAYGYGVEQIIYSADRSGKIDGFQKEDFWRFEPQKDLIHVKLINTTHSELLNKVLPYGKWILTTNDGSYSNPLGEPMFERLIQPWIFRCNGWDLWMDFAKRFANGFMHAKIGDPAQQTAVRKELEKAAKSAIIVTDKDSDLTMVQASRDSAIYTSIDDKTVKTMQKVILGETLTSDMAVRGSSGAAQVHEEVRYEKTRADIRMVEGAITEAMKQIAAVNGFKGKLPKPKLIFDPGLNAELAARDASLTSAGVKFTKKYYVNNYGLKEDEFEIVEAAPPSFFAAQKKSLFLGPEDVKEYLGVLPSKHVCGLGVELASSVSRKDSRQLNEKEDAVDFLDRNAEPPIDIDNLLAAVSSAKNEKELDANLMALFDNRSNTFEDTLGKTLYYIATKGALLGNPEKLPNEEE